MTPVKLWISQINSWRHLILILKSNTSTYQLCGLGPVYPCLSLLICITEVAVKSKREQRAHVRGLAQSLVHNWMVSPAFLTMVPSGLWSWFCRFEWMLPPCNSYSHQGAVENGPHESWGETGTIFIDRWLKTNFIFVLAHQWTNEEMKKLIKQSLKETVIKAEVKMMIFSYLTNVCWGSILGQPLKIKIVPVLPSGVKVVWVTTVLTSSKHLGALCSYGFGEDMFLE